MKEHGSTFLLGLVLAMAGPTGCIEERCREHRDCPGVKICDTETGRCVYECEEDSDCGESRWFACEDHQCRFSCEGASLACPDGMTPVCGSYCIDVYEASRPDATALDAGIDESVATSRPGVLPWHSGVLTPAEAGAACEAAGKRLCTPQEWEAACAGVDELVYVYGDEYAPPVCNGRDTFCDPACGVFRDCWRECGYDNHVLPTGALPGCTNGFGTFDMSGNVWEAVVSDGGTDHFRGGAHDCGDPALAHRCGYDGIAAGTFPSTRGFRCCADGDPL